MIRLFPFVFALVALLVIVAKTIVVTKEDERLVILRLGRLVAVRGPGRNIIVPFLDRAIKVNVERISGWEKLSETELLMRAAHLALDEDSQGTPTSRD